MTRRDTLVCEHEPFGEPFYYGPERLSERFEEDPEYREKTGHSQTTFKDIFDKIEQDGSQVSPPPTVGGHSPILGCCGPDFSWCSPLPSSCAIF